MRKLIVFLRDAWFVLLNTAVLLAILFVLVELGARYYLAHIADWPTFQKYASFQQLQERARTEGYSFSECAPHRYIGFIPTPNYRFEGNYHNSRGYRGAEIVMPKPKGEFRIACLGGSTTYDSSIKDPLKAYPAQLEAVLRAAGRNVTVINAGMLSWTSYESLVDLEFRLLDLQPDLLVVGYGINDLGSRFVWPPEAYVADNSGMRGPLYGSLFMPGILEYSVAMRALLVYAGRALPHGAMDREQQGTASSYIWLELNRQAINNTFPEGIFTQVSIAEILRRNPPTYFERNLRSTVGVAKEHGVKAFLLTWPCPPRWYGLPEVMAGMEEINQVVRATASATGAYSFDLSEAYPRDPALYAGGLHNNETGALLKANLVAQSLLSLGLIPSPDENR